MRTRNLGMLRSPGDIFGLAQSSARCYGATGAEMGLGKGGSMRQEIYQSDERPEDWDTSVSSKCFVAIANSLMWQALTGEGLSFAPAVNSSPLAPVGRKNQICVTFRERGPVKRFR
jgi:hypothetical protein